MNNVRKSDYDLSRWYRCLSKFKQKSQVTIPKALVEKLGLKVGDKLDIDIEDGKLVITPVVIIPKSQEWFYTPEWQAKEKKWINNWKKADWI